MADKRTIYVGGLADEVTEKLLNDAFIPFGDLVDIQMPMGKIFAIKLKIIINPLLHFRAQHGNRHTKTPRIRIYRV